MNKKVAIMQPYFFPYIGYYQLIKSVDEFVFYDDVQYIKGGWVNRNRILVDGKIEYIRLGIDHPTPNKNINQLIVKDSFKELKRTLNSAYEKAPYIEQVLLLINEICSFDSRNLGAFLGNSIKKVSDYLGINTKLLYSSELKKDNILKGQEKVISICKELSADIYINAIGGQQLYDKSKFKKENMELYFLHTKQIEYTQNSSVFVPSLSIIDLMMFNAPNEINAMLDNYELL